MKIWFQYKLSYRMHHNPDPVRYEDGAWWFWDETWTYRDGPFITKKLAQERLAEYCEREL